MSTRLPLLLVLVVLPLVSCESEFGYDPTAPRPTRAVQSPNYVANPNGELMGGPQGAVPLVTVDFANKKEESPRVHTIVDDLRQATATAPAGNAATRPTVQERVMPIPFRIVEQQKSEDQFLLSLDQDGNAVIIVTSPSGSGTAMLERSGDTWPAMVYLTFTHGEERPFTSLKTFSVAETPDATRRLPLKSNVAGAKGQADVMIPSFARSPRISLEWGE